MTVQIGAPAPDFALKDQHGQTVRLADFAGGQNVALVFYPFAFSGICTGELCELRDNLGIFADANVQLVGVSCDPMHAQRAWAEQEKYEFPLLSDFWPHGDVAQRYGVFNETTGFANRGSFLIDIDGIVRFAECNEPGVGRDPQRWKDEIAALLAD